jgi:hypothetical protein
MIYLISMICLILASSGIKTISSATSLPRTNTSQPMSGPEKFTTLMKPAARLGVNKV